MKIDVTRVEWNEILPLRELYRAEMSHQIVHDSFPARGLSDPYLLAVDGRVAAYGSVNNRYDLGAVDEFYTLPMFRAGALPLFRELLAASRATHIRVQTNDRLMLLMLYDCASDITSDTILFEDAFTTQLPSPGGVFRQTTSEDIARYFVGQSDPPGWIIEHDGALVASGGVLFHYNPPYGDVYYEVREAYRRRGYASWFVQEMKRVCYGMGKIPVARCNVDNVGSRRTMEKAGLLPCARILIGEIVPTNAARITR